jgi:hypothetical protein
MRVKKKMTRIVLLCYRLSKHIEEENLGFDETLDLDGFEVIANSSS